MELGAYAAQRAAGLRQYEIADHLGNVKATVTGLPALSQQAGQLKKGPAIKAAYDHYPFGMFMPGRYVQDSADRCMTVAQERWLTRWETVCKGRAEWPWQGDLPGGSAYVGPVDNYIWAYMTGSSQRASFRVDAPTVGEGMVATLEVAYVNQAAKVYVVEHGPSGDVLLAARDIYSGGSYPMMFVPSTGNITIDIVGPTDMGLYRLCFDKLVSEQQTVIVDVCDKIKDSYPYGYNGQEKVNEIAGPGNHNTAEFWEYDTRIARRWNLDPVDQISISNYAAFKNSPMWFSDHQGNAPSTDVTKNENGTYTVVGGKTDGDLNIYLQDDKGKRTGEIIGKSLTEYSFLNDDANPMKGAIINPKDKSGINFLNDDIIGGNLSLWGYMSNATGGQKYDFKREGTIKGDANYNNPKYHYRGMQFEGIAHFGNRDGNITTFASARDFGNVAAGFIAGNKGLSWGAARLGFDALESYQRREFSREGQPTQRAERMGHGIGIKVYNDRELQRKIKEAFRKYPIGPKY